MRERLTCWGRREKTENNRETWILKTTRRGCSGPKAAGSHLPLLARPQPPLYDKMLALRKICASEGLFMKGLEAKFFNIFFSILKSRHITLPTKVCRVKAMVFPVVMYGCESWTIKRRRERSWGQPGAITTVQKHQFFSTQPSIWSNSHICTGLLEKP